MKKNKLSIQKFKIAALNNTSKIIGGTGAGDGTTGGDDGNTGTGNTVDKKEKCYLGSAIKLTDNSIIQG